MRIKLNGQPYTMRTLWREITVADFDALYYDNSPRAILRTLSDIPDELLERLSDEQIQALADVPDWIQGDIEFMKDEKPFEIGSHSWEKLEQAKDVVSAASSALFSLPRLLLIYNTGKVPENAITDDFGSRPMSEIFSRAFNILESFTEFLKRFEALQDGVDLEPEEKEAGIEDLQSFGAFGTLYSLAKGDPLKFKNVLASPAEDIMFTLLYEHALHGYRRRLHEIRLANLKAENVSNNS